MGLFVQLIEMQALVYETCLFFAKQPPFPTIELKDIRTGQFRRKTNKISIPLWVVGRQDCYQIYYVIHEICHFVTGNGHHGPDFKAAEGTMMLQYTLKPIYAKAYAKRIDDSQTGEVLWPLN